MVMRFHWGLGVGHLYAHSAQATTTPDDIALSHPSQESDPEDDVPSEDELEDAGLARWPSRAALLVRPVPLLFPALFPAAY